MPSSATFIGTYSSWTASSFGCLSFCVDKLSFSAVLKFPRQLLILGESEVLGFLAQKGLTRSFLRVISSGILSIALVARGQNARAAAGPRVVDGAARAPGPAAGARGRLRAAALGGDTWHRRGGHDARLARGAAAGHQAIPLLGPRQKGGRRT